jgi:ribosomal protein S18 acetylase RimI-like enzyme
MAVQPTSLAATQIAPGSPEYQEILTWPFPEEPFYEGQVKRLLEHDIPHRFTYGRATIWLYRDDAGNAVGFGTLQFCNEYSQFTDGKGHAYIPLLAVHPDEQFRGKGYGKYIVQHLIAEAVMTLKMPLAVPFSEYMLLDVYAANVKAIGLYEKQGFKRLNPDNPIPDPQEKGQPYFVMAVNAAVTQT